ncbi:MAG TPA: ATP-binding protein [Candidatus Limnocylindrales bacterium]|nr:ATP-binding protein [Candidatus Limnocylindrales bacterium]
MRERIRNGAAIGIAFACIVLGVVSLLNQRPPFTGVTLRVEGSNLVVDAVDPAVSASEIEPGIVVRAIDGFAVQDVLTPPSDGPEILARSLQGDFSQIGLADPSVGTKLYNLPDLPEPPLAFTLLIGIGLLAGVAIWVRRGHAGETLRPLAIPMAAAAATSLILVPSWAPLNVPLLLCAVSLPTLARLVLADGFIARTAQGPRQWFAAGVALLSTIAYVVIVALYFGLTRHGLLMSQVVAPTAVAFAATITTVPAMILLRSPAREIAGRPRRGRSGDAVPVVLAALTPTVIAFGYLALGLGVAIPLLWLLVVVIILQSNARVSTLQIQRDTVVAATEVERARLAADLHDDALQEMTLLVRRLDDVGDVRAAELARSIADRLREVCGELRLPILDELGAGLALEWLVERVGETSGRPVLLERADAARPPADVELAVFRIAQEALANAVSHGAPPITVRYDAAANRAALSITDHGAGMSADAAAVAGRSGHYGLLNMRQRAEQIGARIDFRRAIDGGTVIGLEWALG